MTRLLYILSIFLALQSNAQDTVRLVHKNYISVYSKSKKYPVLVEWWTTKAMVTCPKPRQRKDNFKADPLLPNETNLTEDYKNSGFDRGHMMPAADNLCQEQNVLEESFYFSNMSAQYHKLNAGEWKTVETMTRQLASKHDSIHVWAGNYGQIKKIGRVSVPEICWKVLHVKSTNKWYAYLFVNDKQRGDIKQEVELVSVTKLTGFRFTN